MPLLNEDLCLHPEHPLFMRSECDVLEAVEFGVDVVVKQITQIYLILDEHI